MKTAILYFPFLCCTWSASVVCLSIQAVLSQLLRIHILFSSLLLTNTARLSFSLSLFPHSSPPDKLELDQTLFLSLSLSCRPLARAKSAVGKLESEGKAPGRRPLSRAGSLSFVWRLSLAVAAHNAVSPVHKNVVYYISTPPSSVPSSTHPSCLYKAFLP